MKIKISLYLLLLLLTITVGCRTPVEQIVTKPPYDRPLLPGQQALSKVTNPSQIPDFTSACLDLRKLKLSIEKSLHYLTKPSSKQFFPVSGITHQRAVDSLVAFSDLLDPSIRQVEQTLASSIGEQAFSALVKSIRDRSDIQTFLENTSTTENF